MLSDKGAHLKHGGQALIGGLHVTVDRNHFGRQLSSFEMPLIISKAMLSHEKKSQFMGVFIRAPSILQIDDDSVEILATIPSSSDENGIAIVAVQQENILGTAFHPELTNDPLWHNYFVQIIRQAQH
jgi:pyridoxal 5'-phosphate synthase pdxT subunit